jgi:hypothetical protein
MLGLIGMERVFEIKKEDGMQNIIQDSVTPQLGDGNTGK